jgi:uncharacterized membrane protein
MTLDNKKFGIATLLASIALGLLMLVTQTWLSVPLGLLYVLIIPGFLMLLTIQRAVSLSWSTVIYSLAIGITLFTFLALFVNVIGRLLGNTHPLTIDSLVIANFLLIAVLSVGQRRWALTRPALQLHFTRLEIGLLASALLLVIGMATGAILLNNGASGIISFICFLTIPILFIVLFWKSQGIKSGVVICTLWLIALGLLFSGWLRSWYVSGPDVSLEYRLAEIVSTNNLWSLDTIKHAYNACLSVSLFAPAIGIVTKSSLVVVFKFVIPFLYSFTVPIVYLIAKRFLEKRAGIVAAAFFMAQPVFVVWWWIPIRQQVAFLLFGAALLLITEFKRHSRQSLLILLILSLGLVVAHYTTALIAIAYFVIVWLVAIALSRHSRFTALKSPVPPAIIVLLISAYFLWYAQLAYGFSGVTEFITRSLGGISEIVMHTDQSSDADKNRPNPLAQLNIFSNQKLPEPTLQEYADLREKTIRTAYGEKNMYDSSDTSPYPVTKTPPVRATDGVIQTIRQIFIAISKILIIAGAIAITWMAIRNERLRRYATLSLSALLMLVITTLLPSFSVSYDLVRTYQQLLFVMAGIYVLIFFVPRRFRSIGNAAIVGFVAVYFIFTSHTLSYLSSSPSVPANLANQGNEYTYRYAHRTDVALGEWLTTHVQPSATISGDSLARDRLRITLDPKRSQAMLNTVLPSALPRNGYVIKNTRVNANSSYDSFESALFIYSYPTQFLADKKNIVYSNSENQLFR